MDANPNSSNFFGDRLAELISKTIKKQLAQSDKSSVLQPRLEQMVEQQQQTNTQLSHLVKYASQLSDQLQENTQQVQKAATLPFWKKMALEVPPVVLAVLLAFGINSWWQQRQQVQIAAEAKKNIIDEVERNLQTLGKSYEENQRRLSKIEVRIQRAENSFDTLVEGTGVQVFPLADAAWQTAHIIGAIQDFDPIFIQEAAYVYGLQKDIKEELFIAVSAVYDINVYKTRNILPALNIEKDIIKEYTESSEVVIRYCREFLKKYDQPIGKQ